MRTPLSFSFVHSCRFSYRAIMSLINVGSVRTRGSGFRTRRKSRKEGRSERRITKSNEARRIRSSAGAPLRARAARRELRASTRVSVLGCSLVASPSGPNVRRVVAVPTSAPVRDHDPSRTDFRVVASNRVRARARERQCQVRPGLPSFSRSCRQRVVPSVRQGRRRSQRRKKNKKKQKKKW